MTPQIVLLGDSIRLHYQPLVAADLGNEASVIGPAENAQSSEFTLRRLDAWLADLTPQIIHLNCGLHDLRRDLESGEPLVALADYQSNLASIFARLERLGCPIIWATITPVDEERHLAARASRRTNADIAAYNAAALEIALQHKARINDLGGAVSAAGAGDLLGPDGVHFIERGYRFLAGQVAASIRALLPE